MIAIAAAIAAAIATCWVYARWARTYTADVLEEWWHQAFELIFN